MKLNIIPELPHSRVKIKESEKKNKRKKVKISKFIHRETELKLVHYVVLTRLGFRKPLFFGLLDTNLHRIQSIMNAAVRINFKMFKFSTAKITV